MAISYGFEDEIVNKLLENESHFEEDLAPKSSTSTELMSNHFISTLYTGPTIQDIENALSITTPEFQTKQGSNARMPLLERNLSKVEHKYTLKIKCCGNSMAGDGYKWRKYGQKTIKNSPSPRSYYRCTNPRCSAKKQVERSNEDPDTLIITYEGLHLHFAYPFFTLDESQDVNLPVKKTKKTNSGPQYQPPLAKEGLRNDGNGMLSSMFGDCMRDMEQGATGAQGLLEDVVPLTIRNPSNHLSVSNSSSSYSPDDSPPTSPSSISWSSYSPLF